MSAAGSPALKQWTTIIRRWPVDKVRPQNVAFQTVMQKRIDRITNPSAADGNKVKANEALVSQPPVWNEHLEMQQAKALETLLSNKYSRQYPMPQNLRHPASNPTHYDNLIKELHEAPERNWFGKVMNRITGGLRLK